MTNSISATGNAASASHDTLQSMDHQEQSEQRRLDDELDKRVVQEKKKRPEDIAGMTPANWQQLPREVQKVISTFVAMLGAQPVQDGTAKAATEETSTSASTPHHAANTAFTQQPNTELVPDVSGTPLSAAASTQPEPVNSLASHPHLVVVKTDGQPSVQGLKSGDDGAAGGDDSNQPITTTALERNHRAATIERLAEERERPRDAESAAPATLLANSTPQAPVPQPAPQQSPDRFASTKANEARLAAAELRQEGLRYQLKSWGGDQSVTVTGTAQTGYVASGSDHHVDRVLHHHGDDAVPVKVAVHDSAPMGSAGVTGNASADTSTSDQ